MDASTSAKVCPAVLKSTKAGTTHNPCTVPAMLFPEGLPRVISPALLMMVDTQPLLEMDTPYACRTHKVLIKLATVLSRRCGDNDRATQEAA
jgi:hypothetical protein